MVRIGNEGVPKPRLPSSEGPKGTTGDFTLRPKVSSSLGGGMDIKDYDPPLGDTKGPPEVKGAIHRAQDLYAKMMEYIKDDRPFDDKMADELDALLKIFQENKGKPGTMQPYQIPKMAKALENIISTNPPGIFWQLNDKGVQDREAVMYLLDTGLAEIIYPSPT